MLCMRPVNCRGLPIFLLHHVFGQYISLSKEALPATQKARIALQVARELCGTMGNYFDSEVARRDAFLRAIRPLFSQWAMSKEVMSQGTAVSTRTDTTVSVNEVAMMLTEVKNGKNGDAYMQGCRGYEVITESLTEKNPIFLSRGAPTFIACLNGSFRLIRRESAVLIWIVQMKNLEFLAPLKTGNRSLSNRSRTACCIQTLVRMAGRFNLRNTFLLFSLVLVLSRRKLRGTYGIQNFSHSSFHHSKIAT